MDYPCQICNAIQRPPREQRYIHRLICIGKISDLCQPIEAELLASQAPDSAQPVCNYAESIDGSFIAADSHYGMFSSTWMLSYRSSRSAGTTNEIVESVGGIRWAATGNAPIKANRPGLKVSTNEQGELEAPIPLVFPICARCSRMVRNYLTHRSVSQPAHSADSIKPHGFECIYDAMLRRFLRASRDLSHPHSLYRQEDTDEVNMLGRAVVVRSVSDAEVSKIEISDDIFSQIPSLPRWIMSKLQPISQQHTDEPVQSTRGCTTPNALVDLPNELIDQIVWHLDRRTVMAFRLTHPSFAASLPLDQAFWCNELLYGKPPLFGFEPLYADVYNSWRGERMARIDALSEVRNHFTKPRTRSEFVDAQQPLSPVIKGLKIRKREWQDYDWKGLVRMLASSAEFEDDASCADAPPGFCTRRRLWGALDKLILSS